MTSRIQDSYDQTLQDVVFRIRIHRRYMTHTGEVRLQRTGTEGNCSTPNVIEEGRADLEEVLWVGGSGTGKHEIGEILISSGFR